MDMVQLHKRLFEIVSVRNCLQSLLDALPDIYDGEPVENIIGNMMDNKYIQEFSSLMKSRIPIDQMSAFIFFSIKELNDEIQCTKNLVNDQ